MVQARQISVYAAAALNGTYPSGGDLALRASDTMIRTYFEGDGAPGWLFSVDRSGRAVDVKRDLYAHAFAIFGLAWAIRLDYNRKQALTIAKTLEILDRDFADASHGGYWDGLPRSDRLRRHNPHMHLFEALLALFEATEAEEALHRCQKLHALAMNRFFSRRAGVIREYFDDDWNVHPASGLGNVEPGHLLEWAWLLRRFEAASGLKQDEPVSMLIGAALRYGVDAALGRVVGEIYENGTVRSASTRVWPHAEALHALSEEMNRGPNAQSQLVISILRRLRTVYCPDRLDGGWVDHVDANDEPISIMMPASSLYHLYFGIGALSAATAPAS
jgi:mannose-6-phosphate isomerase